jgi:hypothetical protein
MVGVCKRTIEMVEIGTNRIAERWVAKRVKKVNVGSHCFFDGMAIHFRSHICRKYLGNWYNSSVKATISRSLIVFIIFTSLFDLAGGRSIEISPGGRNRVFSEILHPGL